jgi:ureidoacrylate peracid hydrolase
MDYYVTLVADCCGAASERDHGVALERFDRDYGSVVSSADVIGVWRSARPSAGTKVRSLVGASSAE